MTNILIIINSLQFGGWAEKVATMVGDQFSQEEWYTVRYLTFYDAQKKYPYKGEEICLNETISSNVFIRIFKLFHRAYTIARICKRYHIDYAFSHLEEANFSNVMSKMVFRNTSKIYIQIHGSVNMWGNAYKFFIKKFYKRADRVITLVHEEQENLTKNYDILTSRITTINNPINIGNIQESKKERIWEHEYLFAEWKFNFINIWRLVYEKNQSLLIEAFKEFHKKYPQTQLIIAWEWALRESLKSQIAGYSHCIYLIGNQKNPYKFLANADCFVFSSNSEWFWIVLIEAMACGLPIISRDCKTWPKEILRKESHDFVPVTEVSMEEYGILVPIKPDISFLYSAMEKIYCDKELREQYAKKSEERAQDFDVSIIMEQWKQVISH